ncbi:hypothetical protein IWQ61_001512 [Dispira simplex]|nr:hypothetical protein IWQ61_001512 [Dispira simplex]
MAPSNTVPSSEKSTHIPCMVPPQRYLRLPKAPLTDAQKRMVMDFTTHLPTIIEKTPAEDHVKHQRFCTSACLQRYLRANKWNLTKAEAGLEKTLLWRSEYRPDEITPEEIESEAIYGKMYPNGYDLFGRSTIYMRQRLNHSSNAALQMRYLAFTLERAVQMLPPENNNDDDGDYMVPESLSLIIDCEGWSLSNSVPLNTARETLYILGSHYPERLGTALILNAPWIFWTFFKLVSPFIDLVTRAKIHFVELKSYHKLPLYDFGNLTVTDSATTAHHNSACLEKLSKTFKTISATSHDSSVMSSENPSVVPPGVFDNMPYYNTLAEPPKSVEPFQSKADGSQADFKKGSKSSDVWVNLRNYYSDGYLESNAGGKFDFTYSHKVTWPYICALYRVAQNQQ